MPVIGPRDREAGHAPSPQIFLEYPAQPLPINPVSNCPCLCAWQYHTNGMGDVISRQIKYLYRECPIVHHRKQFPDGVRTWAPDGKEGQEKPEGVEKKSAANGKGRNGTRPKRGKTTSRPGARNRRTKEIADVGARAPF